MVAVASVYLFVGQDNPAKQIKLKEIKDSTLAQNISDFNQDIVYAKDITLRDLQERLLCLPVQSSKRLVVIKQAQQLKEDAREYILSYAQNPSPRVTFVVDMEYRQAKDSFFDALSRLASTIHFKETRAVDTFDLSRRVEFGQAGEALKILHELLAFGEKPERILGGLRYACVKHTANRRELPQKLKLLVECDTDVKTGRVKPEFALEKLVVRLCRFSEPNRKL
ncbi:MAG TPA: hypothetical protein PKL77_02725 [Candidatus Omnitrophota bacterium]|nr:hypothetical protein [Candidatus Omnitrophota bacterium]HPT07073.1 hypothetical protein [Candidatus Omnitrophota bacterium]